MPESYALIEITETQVTGVAAVVAAILVFCGSVWLLLTFVMGPKLAYFVTASVTLGFVLMMGLVWSQTELGPVGQLPDWLPVAIGEDEAEVDFGPASEYPEGPWQEVDEGNESETAKASELESGATDYLEQAIQDGDVDVFTDASDAIVRDDSTRLLEQNGTEYGALVLDPGEPSEEEIELDIPQPEGEVFVVMRYDPGNPLGKARLITAGVGGLFILHLVGLSIIERRSNNNNNEGAK